MFPYWMTEQGMLFSGLVTYPSIRLCLRFRFQQLVNIAISLVDRILSVVAC
jgi:hypothetical protein